VSSSTQPFPRIADHVTKQDKAGAEVRLGVGEGVYR
jgi:hypothetical protein